MPSHQTLNRYITKTRRQLEKQKNKMIYSSSYHDKEMAKGEIERLRSKLSWLQSESNKVVRSDSRDKKTKGDEREHHAV